MEEVVHNLDRPGSRARRQTPVFLHVQRERRVEPVTEDQDLLCLLLWKLKQEQDEQDGFDRGRGAGSSRKRGCVRDGRK